MMRPSAPCRTCLRLRLFLTVALPLVAMIYLQPGGAVRLAGLLPETSVIGWGILAACVLGFVIRLGAWRRDRET